MQLIPSDPDVQTVFLRIQNGDIDLQPDFQRGEVWSYAKRQKLIDSMLRNWHVPPIHVIVEEEGQRISVLDGQQRLAAIRDFIECRLSVNGDIEPFNEKIAQLGGLTFDELPIEVRRKFMQFPLRIFTIKDYEPSEPGELFFRLNQPSSLTAAEQRNAFFGSARKQVKELVRISEDLSFNFGIFGFSNARMAYDDVFAKVLYLLDSGSLRGKITSNVLADKYRSSTPYSEKSVSLLTHALEVLGDLNYRTDGSIKLNKATAQSWLTFIAVLAKYSKSFASSDLITGFMLDFEESRYAYTSSMKRRSSLRKKDPSLDSFLEISFFEYESRSTARVADVSSVVIRDIVIWLLFFIYVESKELRIPVMSESKNSLKEIAFSGLSYLTEFSSIDWLAEELGWGSEL